MKLALFTLGWFIIQIGFTQNDLSEKNTKKLYFAIGTNNSSLKETQKFSSFPSSQVNKSYSNGTGYSLTVGYIHPIGGKMAIDLASTIGTQEYRMVQVADGFHSNFTECLQLFDISVNTRFSPLSGRLQPYLQTGFKYSRLLSSEMSAKRSGGTAVTFDGDILEMRNQNLLSMGAGFGVEYKINGVCLFISTTYFKGLSSLVNEEKRYSNTRLVGDFGHVDSDMILDVISLNVGCAIRVGN